MREKIKLIIIIALVAMLAASIFFGLQIYSAKKTIELERDRLKDENKTLARKIEEVIEERRQLQGKVNALSNDLDKLSQEKQDIQKQYDLVARQKDELVGKLETLQQNNERLRNDISNLTREKQTLGQRLGDDLALLKKGSTELKQQLENLNVLKNKLDSELGQIKGEKSDIERKFNLIELFVQQKLSKAEYAGLQEQLEAMRGSSAPEAPTRRPETESVELPPIVVRPQTPAPLDTSVRQEKSAPVKLTGTILEVNKEQKFVVIDLGEDVGIKVGDTLKVYKQGKVIGTIEVIQVRQSISACDIKEEIKAIEAGDIVK